MYSDRIGEVYVEIVCTRIRARTHAQSGSRVWVRYRDHNVSPPID